MRRVAAGIGGGGSWEAIGEGEMRRDWERGRGDIFSGSFRSRFSRLGRPTTQMSDADERAVRAEIWGPARKLPHMSSTQGPNQEVKNENNRSNGCSQKRDDIFTVSTQSDGLQ